MGVSVLEHAKNHLGALSLDDTTFKSYILNSIQKLEYNFKISDDSLSYGHLVNFETSINYPIHRWFYYNMGFSPELVKKFFKEFSIKSGDTVLDPFVGSGTTSLEAAINGINSVGFEINPFAFFSSVVKSRKYTKKDIREFEFLVNKLKKVKIKPNLSVPKLSIAYKLFDKKTLEKLLAYKQFILKVKNRKVRNLLFYGWLSILERLSNYKRGGNGLKKRKGGNDKNIESLLFSKYTEMINDLKYVFLKFKRNENNFFEPTLFYDSSLNLSNYVNKNSISMSMFSPPYLNCFDYCEAYKIELWFGGFVRNYEELRNLREKSIRSHLNMSWDYKESSLPSSSTLKLILDFLSTKKLWNKHIPEMILGYFSDMKVVLKSIHSVSKKDVCCIIVVGNSAYGNIVIPTDLILAEIGEKIGFKCVEIRIARRNETSSQQHRNLGEFQEYLRESIVILKKK